MRGIMSKVAIVKCEDYLPGTVLSAVKKAIDLVGIDLKKELLLSKNVLIKPNLCNDSRPEEGITTHPEVIKAILQLLNEFKKDVLIGDNSVGRDDPKHLDVVYKTCGIDDIIREFRCKKNYLNNNVEAYTCMIDGKEQCFYLSKKILETSFIINVPKFKTHSLMTFTGAIKNLYGMIPGNTKRQLHVELPDKRQFAQLLVNLYDVVRPKLNIIDAVIGIEGDGPSRSGKKRKIGYIMASENAVALDIVASMMMGIDYMQVPTNAYATQYYGIENVHDFIQILGEPINECILQDFILPNTASFNDHLTEKIFSLSTPKLYIDSDKCMKCMMCLKNCPKAAIHLSQDKKLEIKTSECISCMICMEICPSAAVMSKLPKIYNQLRALSDKKL
jgi:uncharacterized protein (DUF362 family)/Pyruvate/2-oxoacid:ferredoxin oxidoreductase delta subunit